MARLPLGAKLTIGEASMSANETVPRLGDWIETFRGEQFWPIDPRPEDVHIVDIAHALSHQCRYSGHCHTFYSVAEHSVRVSRIVAPEHALWGLLHDAAEAYLVDLPRPLKKLPGFAAYREAEARVMRCVCDHFGLSPEQPKDVSDADFVMLATEARDLMTQKYPWNTMPAPLFESIVPWDSLRAKKNFLRRFDELIGEQREVRDAQG